MQRAGHKALRGRIVARAFRVMLAGLRLLSFRNTERLGRAVGSLVFAYNGRWRRVTLANLAACFPLMREEALIQLARESLRHTGCYAAESAIIWSRGDQRWKSLIAAIEGVDAIDEAKRIGKGVLVLVPHYGNWEILNLFLGARYGLTALYEPARIPEIDPIVRQGRSRTGSTLVPTSPTGIRRLVTVLRRGGVVGLLPDQVPPIGAGTYAPFFGRQALTMRLACRLVERLAPRVIMAHARRLPEAAGFSLCFEVLADVESLGDTPAGLTAMNSAIERLVESDPAQYQWEYKRFKRPRSPEEKLY